MNLYVLYKNKPSNKEKNKRTQEIVKNTLSQKTFFYNEVIVKTFGQLREESNEREDEIKNVCFICKFIKKKLNQEKHFEIHSFVKDVSKVNTNIKLIIVLILILFIFPKV